MPRDPSDPLGQRPDHRVIQLLGSDIVEAQWVGERRGLARLRAEQPSDSMRARGILPVCDRCGMGVLTWSPLAWGLLTGKHRAGQDTPSRLVEHSGVRGT